MRRYATMKQSRGTVIPAPMRIRVIQRDLLSMGGCVGRRLLQGDCAGERELDHVRASGGIGLKSVTCYCNLVSLCGSHHRAKTEHGRTIRPLLLAYLASFGYGDHEEHAVSA